MIPKIIHYCWFGGHQLPDAVNAYIDTWRKYMPDFEIKQWDESNFDVNAMLYTRQAYFAKKYAFVSDVARLQALLSEGGLYLDTDILIKRPFPIEWFDLDGFGSFEHDTYAQTGIMAACANNPIFKNFLESYKETPFFKGMQYDITTNVARFTRILSDVGFKMNNREQTLYRFTMFPQEYLCANDWKTGRYDNDMTYAVHEFKGGWGKEALNAKIKYYSTMMWTILKWKLQKFDKNK